MSDLISRGDAIKAVLVSNLSACTVFGRSEEGMATAKELIQVIKKLPSVQPEQRWIPCSERLPEKKRKTYWVCTDAEYQCECRWTNNRFGFGESDNWGWSYFDVPQYTEVIAWMPLPEPYKEDKA